MKPVRETASKLRVHAQIIRRQVDVDKCNETKDIVLTKTQVPNLFAPHPFNNIHAMKVEHKHRAKKPPIYSTYMYTHMKMDICVYRYTDI